MKESLRVQPRNWVALIVLSYGAKKTRRMKRRSGLKDLPEVAPADDAGRPRVSAYQRHYGAACPT